MHVKRSRIVQNFSSVAPSSEELLGRKEIRSKCLTIVHGFRPETENFDFCHASSESACQEEQNGAKFSFLE